MSDAAILINAERCPFCAHDRLWLWDKGVLGMFAVCCSNPACAATGPISSTPAGAVVLWNKSPRRGTKSRVPNAAYGRMLDEMLEPPPKKGNP